MAIIYAYKDRGLTKDLTMTNSAGTEISPGANDKIRVIIGREGKLGALNVDAQFVVDSDAATANGSSFTKNYSGAANRLRLDASDLDFAAGVYTLFFDFYDNADAGEWKSVSRQVMVLEET